MLLLSRRWNMAAIVVRDQTVLDKAHRVNARAERVIADYRKAETRMRRTGRA